MTKRLDQDLALWEADGLPMFELEARHPNVGVRGLTETWLRLAARGEEPVPDPVRGWEILRARLPERGFGARPGSRFRRPLVAALAAAFLALGGIAYAAGPEGLRDAVNGVVGRIVDVVGGEDAQPGVPAPPPDPLRPGAGVSGPAETDQPRDGEDQQTGRATRPEGRSDGGDDADPDSEQGDGGQEEDSDQDESGDSEQRDEDQRDDDGDEDGADGDEDDAEDDTEDEQESESDEDEGDSEDNEDSDDDQQSEEGED